MISLFLAIFALVGWITGAMRPRRRTWVIVGAVFGGAVLVFYVWAVAQHIRPNLDFDRAVGVHYLPLFAMIGGVAALLASPKPPKLAPINQEATHV